jgi:putative ABC transport system permease protein
MRWLISAHYENARQSLKGSRLRTSLTMLGVAIGVASITAIMALGAGASAIIGKQVDALGGNIAVIRPTSIVSDPLSHLTQLQSGASFASSNLTLMDVAAVAEVPGVDAAAPLVTLSGAIKGESSQPSDGVIVATSPDFLKVSSLHVREGQFIDPDTSPTTVVIGPQLSVNLFGTEESIGKKLQIRGQDFVVSGVLDRSNQPINYNSINFDDSVIMSVESMSLTGADGSQIQQINFTSDSVTNLTNVVTDVNKLLLSRHLNQPDFQILTGSQIAQPTSQLFLVVAGVTTAVAGISLLVGGIGIMNIMLVNVAERTREIGLRKAVGARRADIAWQFLIESIIISIGGGIIGFALGYAIAFVISMFLPFDPAINWQIAVLSIGVSLATGLVFGIYPAARAARKDPIRALRQYD